jgi:hypothetical protein
MSEINEEETTKEQDDGLKGKIKLMKVAVRRLKSIKKKIIKLKEKSDKSDKDN